MLSGVGIICFAGSYAVTLVLEVTRLFFRSGIRGAVMLGSAGAGLFAHTVYLWYQATSAAGSPLSSTQDWYLVAAWVLAATYVYLTCYHPKAAFGVFILPLVLALIGVGTFWADPEPYAREPASRAWGVLHGASILLATVAMLAAFAAGLMYLRQTRRLKRKLPPRRGLRLPSLEWLRRANSWAIGVAVLTLGIGILSGMVLNLYNYGPGTEHLPWNDPVVLSTLVMFGWLLASAGIGVFYRPAREGRKVAFLTMLSFLFLVIALGAVLSANTRHGGRRREGREIESDREETEASGVRVQSSGLGVRGSGARGQGSEFRVWGSGFRVQSSGGSEDGLAAEPNSQGLGTTHLDRLFLRPRWRPQDRHVGPIAHCVLPTAHCPLSTSHCSLPTSHCPLPTVHCPLPTACCPLPAAYCVALSRRAWA
jgi:ABC-type uncharacterized transport system permease subunit